MIGCCVRTNHERPIAKAIVYTNNSNAGIGMCFAKKGADPDEMIIRSEIMYGGDFIFLFCFSENCSAGKTQSAGLFE